MFEIIPFGRRNSDVFKMFDDFEKNFLKASDNLPAGMGFRTDVSEKEGCYLLEAELPGFKKEDISVDISDGVLTISAQTKQETDENKKDYVYRERRYGSYKRSFDLSGIDESGVTGEYNNGILELTLPKLKEEKATARRIELN